MDFKSLKDVNNVKALFLEIWKSFSAEVSKLKDLNKDSFVGAFNKYFWNYLKDEYKKLMQLNLNYFKFEGRATRKQYWMFCCRLFKRLQTTFKKIFTTHLLQLHLEHARIAEHSEIFDFDV